MQQVRSVDRKLVSGDITSQRWLERKMAVAELCQQVQPLSTGPTLATGPNISNIPKNITIKKKDPQLKTLILLNYNNDDEIPKSIFFDIAENTNLEIIQYDISNYKSFLYFVFLVFFIFQ